jgi:RNase P subunit RPR2
MTTPSMSITELDQIRPRQCRRCLVLYPGLEAVAMFRRKTTDQVHLVCIACELTERTRINAANRWLAKARATIAHHAKRFNIPQRRLINDFGWRPDLVAHDFEHAYANSCCYCEGRYDEMPNGLADLTIDIVDPGAAPYYRTNARPCCATCNREKSRTPPHLFAAKLAGWERWRRAHIAWPEGSLFS